MPPKKVPSSSSDGASTSSMAVAKKPTGKVHIAKGYKRPESLPEGFQIEDKPNKRTWRIGDLLGQGGFADVYTVSDHISNLDTAKHVLKLEPQRNGPLFQEIKFFKAAAKKDSIAAFMALNKLKSLGMMEYVASGVMEHNDKELRWLVIPRLGQNVQKIFEENGNRFSRQTVILLAIQLLNVLEYIHSQGYSHGDIKAGNMMTGFAKIDTSQVYLIDFGLVKKFLQENVHIAYKKEPKAAHDGTLELTSIDSYKGAATTRRGDLQILGYNLLKWSVGALPWSDSSDPNFVKSQKMAYLQNSSEFFRVAFPAGETAPKELVEYFKEIKPLEYAAKPNYAKLRGIFEAASKEVKVRKSDLFQAAVALPPSPKKLMKKTTTSSVDAFGTAALGLKKPVRKPAAAPVDDRSDFYGDQVEKLPKTSLPAAKTATSKPPTALTSANDVSVKPIAAVRKKAASVSDQQPSTSAAISDHVSELTSTLATLPSGQRRNVKAAAAGQDTNAPPISRRAFLLAVGFTFVHGAHCQSSNITAGNDMAWLYTFLTDIKTLAIGFAGSAMAIGLASCITRPRKVYCLVNEMPFNVHISVKVDSCHPGVHFVVGNRRMPQGNPSNPNQLTKISDCHRRFRYTIPGLSRADLSFVTWRWGTYSIDFIKETHGDVFSNLRLSQLGSIDEITFKNDYIEYGGLKKNWAKERGGNKAVILTVEDTGTTV